MKIVPEQTALSIRFAQSVANAIVWTYETIPQPDDGESRCHHVFATLLRSCPPDSPLVIDLQDANLVVLITFSDDDFSISVAASETLDMESTVTDETIAKILNWSERDRAKLTYQLLLSLEDASPDELSLCREDIDRLWSEETQRRLADFDAGRIGCVSSDEALRSVRRDLA